ncbi:MAG: mechanosensitive ion channel family protein [Planctomycetota bacterium]
MPHATPDPQPRAWRRWLASVARFAAAVALVFAAGIVIGQAANDPPTPAPEPADDSAVEAIADNDAVTIEIDPDALPGVTVTTPGADAEAEPAIPEPTGPVGRALDDLVQDTGVNWIDSAVNTLISAVSAMLDGFIQALPRMAIALVLLVLVGLVLALGTGLARKAFTRMRLRESLRDLFLIFIKTGVWVAALLVAAGIVFPGFGLTQIVATAGLASIAIGFAFQDIFENFFAGILILWRFPFENGDFIEIDGLEGKVEDVEVRMTRLRLPNGELVLIPNSKIFKNIVHVETDWPARRIEIVAGVAYQEDADHARDVIYKAVDACDTVMSERGVLVLASEFADSSVNFDVAWWTEPNPLNRRKSTDEVIRAIKRALDAEGIEIPYPYRTLTFSKNEPDIIHAVAGRASPTRDAPDAELNNSD